MRQSGCPIRVNSVHPGIIDTPIWTKLNPEFQKRWLTHHRRQCARPGSCSDRRVGHPARHRQRRALLGQRRPQLHHRNRTRHRWWPFRLRADLSATADSGGYRLPPGSDGCLGQHVADDQLYVLLFGVAEDVTHHVLVVLTNGRRSREPQVMADPLSCLAVDWNSDIGSHRLLKQLVVVA